MGHVTQAVTCGLYIACIRTHSHDRQVTSMKGVRVRTWRDLIYFLEKKMKI